MLTWNLAGFHRNKTNLKFFVDTYLPSFIFLSETNLYQCDLSNAMVLFRGEYMASLNSQDLYDLELPLTKTTTFGGTMILWRQELNPFISVVSVDSTAFLPLVFAPPDQAVSVHISVYLPTQGQESEFIDCLSSLSMVMEELSDKYPKCTFYL